MKALTVFLAACVAICGYGYEPPVHTNSYTQDGVTYAQRGGLGVSNYVAVAVNALENDYIALTNNSNFKAAVETVSPPAELPSKWALANVTNRLGQSVKADDVYALPVSHDGNNFTMTGGYTLKTQTTNGGFTYFGSFSPFYLITLKYNSDFSQLYQASYGCDAIDYQVGMNSYKLTLPQKTSTLATMDDIPTVPSISGTVNMIPKFTETGIADSGAYITQADGYNSGLCVSPTTGSKVGNASYLFGHSAYQLGSYATAIGGNLKCGNNSVAIGWQANAGTGLNYNYSVCVGYSATSTNTEAVCIGRLTKSHGNKSFNINATSPDLFYFGDKSLTEFNNERYVPKNEPHIAIINGEYHLITITEQ